MFEPAVPGTRNDPGMDNGLISAMLPPLAGEWPPNLACVGFACGNIGWRWELKMTIRSKMLAGAVAACCLAMGFAGAATAQTMEIIFPPGGVGCNPKPSGTSAMQIIDFNCSYYGGIVSGRAIVAQAVNPITLAPVTNLIVTNFLAQTNGLTTSATGSIKFRVPQNVATSGNVFINMALTGQFYFGPGSILGQPNSFSIGANITTHPFAHADTIYAFDNDDHIASGLSKTFSFGKTGLIGVDDPNYLYVTLGFGSSAFFSPTVTGISMPGSFHVAIGKDAASAVFLPVHVPEPETWTLMVAGFGAVGLMARRRRPALAA